MYNEQIVHIPLAFSVAKCCEVLKNALRAVKQNSAGVRELQLVHLLYGDALESGSSRAWFQKSEAPLCIFKYTADNEKL